MTAPQMNPVVWSEFLEPGDYDLAIRLLRDHPNWTRPRDESYGLPDWDLCIAPDGEPYLFRWHLFREKQVASSYFHIQVASDPERPLHDHPWDNTSVVLAGGYDETIWRVDVGQPYKRALRKGSFVSREAEDAHRLELPAYFPYTMTLFHTGPVRRTWGFWYPDGWHSNERHVAERNGKSMHVKENHQ